MNNYFRKGKQSSTNPFRLPRPLQVNDVLRRVIKHKGLEKDFERYNFVLHWEGIVGKDAATYAKPECLQKTTLFVRVSNSVWAQELSLKRQEILKKLRKFLVRGQVVRNIRFYVDGGV